MLRGNWAASKKSSRYSLLNSLKQHYTELGLEIQPQKSGNPDYCWWAIEVRVVADLQESHLFPKVFTLLGF